MSDDCSQQLVSGTSWHSSVGYDGARACRKVSPHWQVEHRQRYHFSGISGNLEMSGNSAKVREKAQSHGKVREFV